MPPSGRTSEIHWGAVWTTGVFLAFLVGILCVVQLWALAAWLGGLTVGLGLIVVGQHRENQGENGRRYRRSGLALLLIIMVGFFVSYLLRSTG